MLRFFNGRIVCTVTIKLVHAAYYRRFNDALVVPHLLDTPSIEVCGTATPRLPHSCRPEHLLATDGRPRKTRFADGKVTGSGLVALRQTSCIMSEHITSSSTLLRMK